MQKSTMVKWVGVALIGSAFAMSASAIPFEGKAIGSWDTPVKESSSSTYTIGNNDSGGGLATLTWGTAYWMCGSRSYMTFDGAGSDPNLSPAKWNSGFDPFLLGNLSFYNGVINADSGLKGIKLDVDVTITSPNLGPLSTFTYGLGINNTVNPRGDRVWEISTPDSQTFQYNNGTSVETYLFDILGFRQQDCQGNWSYVTSLFASEGNCTSAQLMGRVVSQGSGVPVPDAGATVILMGLVITSLAALRMKIA
jgi:hypothetical protein